MLVRTFVYRLRPTRAQHAALASLLESERLLYNGALEERIQAWRKAGLSIGLNDQTRSLTQIRHADVGYGERPYNVSKWTLKRLDDAFKAFFRRCKAGQTPGFPRYRSMSRWHTFGFHQAAGLRIKAGRLWFSSGLVGGLRMKMHRPIPEGALLKSATFTRDGSIWHVALTLALPAVAARTDGSMLGIDVGVEYLAIDSDGRHYENARPMAMHAKADRRAARALARAVQGSCRRRKAVRRLARIRKKIRAARTTHLHTVAKAIVRSAATIVVEDLSLKFLTRSARGTPDQPGTNVRQKAGLNRALQDAAPGRLIQMLTDKAASAGGSVLKVDPRGTSQTCSACGARVAKTLAVRRHVCACGADMHRDHNAALNILQRGRAAHEAARGLGELNGTGRGVRAPGNADLVAA